MYSIHVHVYAWLWWSCIHVICRREDVIRLLVENNASVTEDEFKLDNAMKLFQWVTVCWLISHTHTHTCTHAHTHTHTILPRLAAADDVEGLKVWRMAGVDLEHINHSGFTLLEVVGWQLTNTRLFLLLYGCTCTCIYMYM